MEVDGRLIAILAFKVLFYFYYFVFEKKLISVTWLENSMSQQTTTRCWWRNHRLIKVRTGEGMTRSGLIPERWSKRSSHMSQSPKASAFKLRLLVRAEI